MRLSAKTMRLDKFLRERAIATRAETKKLIEQKRITVNGILAESHSMEISDGVRVCIDGTEIEVAEPVYLLLYKPAGCITATSSDTDQTVLDLLPTPYREMPLFPVGRLDKASEGLLILTNDGEFCTRVIEPEHHVPKTYYIEVGRPFTDGTEEAFSAGIVFPNGTVCRPAKITVSPDRMSAQVTITEGKTHQVRRMAMACGSRVHYLKRIAIGKLFLPENLAKGDCIPLTQEQLQLIFA